MGAGVSNWRLAQAVSRIGQLGVVSGTGLADIVCRRLQDGDPGGHIRRALAHFPFPSMAKRVLDSFFISDGKSKSTPYLTFAMFDLEGRREPQELSIVGNFVEVFLAREGHANPVGINYLEKIQLPHLPSIYGALLAGAAVVIMGAGIPLAVPEVLSALSRHQPAEYPVYVVGQERGGEPVKMTFDPSDYTEGDALPQVLDIPDFIPIVSSEALASILLRKASGPIDGFIVEGNLAGGHNAPPRGRLNLNDAGEPIYGPRDNPNFAAFRDMGLPFWLAGSYGSTEGLKRARDEGAEGIQVGTAFALCEESGLTPDMRHELINKALAGDVRVLTDAVASPTGFPFKVVELAGSLSDDAVYQRRRRGCDLGFLRQPYRREDGKVGYRCAAEPVGAYVKKGGRVEDTVGRKCLCNALIANVGMAQTMPDGTEDKCLVTMGDDLLDVGRFCSPGSVDFSAEHVIRVIMG
jgi:nitronate monooxygenase